MEQKNYRHDTHAIPPQAICDLYKKYQKMDDSSIDSDPNIVDFARGLTNEQTKRIVPCEIVPSDVIAEAQREFVKSHWNESWGVDDLDIYLLPEPTPCTVYNHLDFPGVQIRCFLSQSKDLL